MAGLAGAQAVTALDGSGSTAAQPCYEDVYAGAPAAGGSRGVTETISMSGRGPINMNGPGSIRWGGERGHEVSKLVDRMVSLANDTRLIPPVDMAKRLGELVGNDPTLYRRVAGQLLRNTRGRDEELRSQTVGLIFDSIYGHLPAMRMPFAQVLLWRIHNLFVNQSGLSPNQMRIVKKMVENRPEWAAEVVKYIRSEDGPVDGCKRKIASALDISLDKPVEVDWLNFELDETYSRR